MLVKKKILILGDKGMLAHTVKRYFKEKEEYEVIGKNRKDFDARNLQSVTAVILETKPDYVINCVGILNNQSKSAQLYSDVNIVFPKYLAMISKHYKFKLLHVSTNCVYKEKGPHNVSEPPTATDLYGLSKAFGEIDDKHNLTIRTSFIGPELKKDGCGLFQWFTEKTGKKTGGYTTAIWNGVTTLQLAKFMDKVIKNDNLKGIINYYSKKPITKYALLWAINEIYGLNKEIEAVAKEGVHSSLLTGQFYTEKDIPTQIRELKSWY